MHKATFSQNERTIITRYLETGEQLPGFRVLKHRVLSYGKNLEQDQELLSKFITKMIELNGEN